MRFLSSFLLRAVTARALFVFALLLGAVCLNVTPALVAQEKPKEVKLSEGEAKLAEKIEKAAGAAAKLQAAEEFIKQYPQSSLRPQLVEHLSAQIMGVQNDAQKITLAERYLALFSGPGEGDTLSPVLVNAYVSAKKFDDAYRAGAAWLEKRPDDALVLANLSFHAIAQAQAGNTKFLPVAEGYGTRALKLFEAETVPAGYDATLWNEAKASWRPKLHQSLGLLALVNNKPADALKHLDQAAALNPNDAATFYLLASAKDEEYRQMAAQYQSMAAGAPKDELLKKINAKMDEIIDHYARTAALTEGQPQHQQLREQVMQSMTAYYKFRNNGSTDGMQKLIDKHKKPATQ